MISPTLAEHEREVIAAATAWSVVAFHGRERGYTKRLVRTLAEARDVAKTIYEDRPVGIYAIAGTRSVLAELYDPRRCLTTGWTNWRHSAAPTTP